MAKIRISTLITAMAVAFFFPFAAQSKEQNPQNVYEQKVITITKVLEDGTVITETTDTLSEDVPMEDLLNDGANTPKIDQASPQSFSPLTLGLEVSTGVDLSALDLSTFNVDLLAGYRNSFIHFVGVQFGIHKSLGSRDSFLPICAVFRSSFTRKPAPVFMHLAAGYSFNTISSSKMFGDITAAIGCGVKLTQRPKFQSNIILSFGFRHFNQRHRMMTNIDKPNSAYAQISFGVSM